VGLREWAVEQGLDARDPGWGKCERAVRAGPADRAAGLGRVADERLGICAALRATREMREIPGEPEQLELEREPERVERRTGVHRREAVEEIEEPGQRLEGPRVCLLLGEQAQHRLRAEQPDPEPVLLLPRLAMRAEELDARHSLQLPRALVQHQLDV
jgi:hypothetical protein